MARPDLGSGKPCPADAPDGAGPEVQDRKPGLHPDPHRPHRQAAGRQRSSHEGEMREVLLKALGPHFWLQAWVRISILRRSWTILALAHHVVVASVRADLSLARGDTKETKKATLEEPLDRYSTSLDDPITLAQQSMKGPLKFYQP